MGHNAWLKTRETTWNKIAQLHINLFCEILGKTIASEEQAAGVAS